MVGARHRHNRCRKFFKLADGDMELSCAISLLCVDGCLDSIMGDEINVGSRIIFF